MTESTKEYMAAQLRAQIANLRDTAEYLEMEPMEWEGLSWRLKAVELGLKRLRAATHEKSFAHFGPISDSRPCCGREAA